MDSTSNGSTTTAASPLLSGNEPRLLTRSGAQHELRIGCDARLSERSDEPRKVLARLDRSEVQQVVLGESVLGPHPLDFLLRRGSEARLDGRIGHVDALRPGAVQAHKVALA